MSITGLGLKESKRLAICLVCLLACAYALGGAPPEKSKQYHNENFDFCLQFPSTWTYQESFTRNGAGFAPKDGSFAVMHASISVGAHTDQPSETGTPQTVDQNIQAVAESLRKYDAAVDIQILKREELTLQGLPARTVTLRYRNSQSGEDRFLKDINLVDDKNIVYFLELECHPNDGAALLPVFDRIVKSLRLACRKNSPRMVN